MFILKWTLRLYLPTMLDKIISLCLFKYCVNRENSLKGFNYNRFEANWYILGRNFALAFQLSFSFNWPIPWCVSTCCVRTVIKKRVNTWFKLISYLGTISYHARYKARRSDTKSYRQICHQASRRTRGDKCSVAQGFPWKPNLCGLTLIFLHHLQVSSIHRDCLFISVNKVLNYHIFRKSYGNLIDQNWRNSFINTLA